MPAENIFRLFAAAAEQHPGQEALVQDGRPVTYTTLLSQVMQTAAHYHHKGIRQGDKVLVFVPMSPHLYRIVLALFHIGAVPVFLDEWVSMGRLKACCRLVPCRALIAGPKLLLAAFFLPELRKIPIHIRATRYGRDELSTPAATVEESDTALITFTTGTTGTPKAANRTHGFLHAQYEALYPLLHNDCRRAMVTLPIVVLINLGLGKCTLLPPRRFKTKEAGTVPLLLQDLIREKADELICSPAILQDMCTLLAAERQQADHVVKITTGGGAVFPELARQVQDIFPAAAGTVVYGSTESEPVSHMDMPVLAGIPWQDIYTSGLCVGQADKAATIAIIPYSDAPIPAQTSESFRTLQLPYGQRGEIVVTGRHVLKTYIHNEAAFLRHKINVDGSIWHRTGDMGCIGTDGQLYFSGPCKEAFSYQDRMYYPLLHSYAFQQMTGVAHCALLYREGQLTLVMAASKAPDPKTLETALQALELSDAVIHYLPSIPMDPRHRTKTDYETLDRLL